MRDLSLRFSLGKPRHLVVLTCLLLLCSRFVVLGSSQSSCGLCSKLVVRAPNSALDSAAPPSRGSDYPIYQSQKHWIYDSLINKGKTKYIHKASSLHNYKVTTRVRLQLLRNRRTQQCVHYFSNIEPLAEVVAEAKIVAWR